MRTALTVRKWGADNWFLLLAPVLLLISYLFTRSTDWASAGTQAEAVTVFDLCVGVPLLYFLCYRRTLPGKQMLLRLIAVACLGVWIASRMVPLGSQELLPRLEWARWAGLSVLVLIELRLIAAVLKLVFSGSAKTDDLEKTGVPPLVAKLMLIEARFWRAAWKLIRGR